VILHEGYGQETDDYRKIRDQLELQETVAALEQLTKRTACTFAEQGDLVRGPGINYFIGHGVRGEVQGWKPDTFAAELARRGLADGDQIVVIACWAGAPGGFAQLLAAQIHALGKTGVIIKAPRNIIHWNKNGELLVDDYPSSELHGELKKALRAQTDAEDEAWSDYVRALKDRIKAVIKLALPRHATDVNERVLSFARARPEDNKQKTINQLIQRASAGEPQEKTLTEIVDAARPVPGGGTGEMRQRWAKELRDLLTDLHSLNAADTGPATAAAEVAAARVPLRAALAAAWTAYSANYYDAIRSLANPNPFDNYGWVTFDST
jgi:hypothetical protein